MNGAGRCPAAALMMNQRVINFEHLQGLAPKYLSLAGFTRYVVLRVDAIE